jgi:hypothetical protein
MTQADTNANDQGIFHLIYVSTALIPFSVQALEVLLSQSRRDNSTYGISGLLIYGGGNFMQLLEGSRPAVEALYRNIESDPRHHEVTTILTHSTRERWCADWTMAFNRHDDGKKIDGWINLIRNSGQVLDDFTQDHLARRLMHGFIEGNR